MKTPLALHLAIIVSTATAFACSAPPEEQLSPATELVQRTPTIVLARVTKVERGERGIYHYTFKSEKTLKGKPADTFIIDGWSPEFSEPAETFDDHTKDDFWKDNGGRCHNSSDCQIHPAFTAGAAYLIFLEAPYHRKSFELIAHSEGLPEVRDKWLTWVEEQAKAPTAKPPAAK